MTLYFSKYRRRLWYSRWNYYFVTSLHTLISFLILLALSLAVVYLLIDAFILEDDLRQSHQPPYRSESSHVQRP